MIRTSFSFIRQFSANEGPPLARYVIDLLGVVTSLIMARVVERPRGTLPNGTKWHKAPPQLGFCECKECHNGEVSCPFLAAPPKGLWLRQARRPRGYIKQEVRQRKAHSSAVWRHGFTKDDRDAPLPRWVTWDQARWNIGSNATKYDVIASNSFVYKWCDGMNSFVCERNGLDNLKLWYNEGTFS